jgi:hypothetical protein
LTWHRPPICSKTWASVWSALLFIGLFILLGYFDGWWRNLPLALGLALILRQYLRSRIVDCLITAIIFIPLYVFVRFHVGWIFLIPMPTLFIAAAAVIFFHEIFVEWRDYQKRQPR